MGCFDADEKISGYLCRSAVAVPCVFQKGLGRSAESHYPTMGIDEIRACRWRSWQKRIVPCFCG